MTCTNAFLEALIPTMEQFLDSLASDPRHSPNEAWKDLLTDSSVDVPSTPRPSLESLVVLHREAYLQVSSLRKLLTKDATLSEEVLV